VEAFTEGEEAADRPLQGQAGVAVESLHRKGGAGPGSGDDIGHAVAVDVSDRHADTAPEGGRVGEKAELELAGGGVVHVAGRGVARVGAGGQARADDLGPAEL